MEEKRGRGRPVGSSKRMNKIESNNFLKESIRRVLTNHLSYKEYIQWCRSNDLSEPRCNVWWKTVWDSIKEKSELSKEQMVSKHLLKYWEIYSEALEKQDLTNARQALNDIAKMMGLNEPDKMDVSSVSVIKFNFGDEIVE